MFALFRDLSNAASEPCELAATVAAEPRFDRYRTDGCRLYRVVDAFSNSSDDMLVGLEDCRTLEVILMPAEELRALALRPISPATKT